MVAVTSPSIDPFLPFSAFFAALRISVTETFALPFARVKATPSPNVFRSFTRSFKPTEPENSTVSVVRAQRSKAIFSNSRSAISDSYSSAFVDGITILTGRPSIFTRIA